MLSFSHSLIHLSIQENGWRCGEIIFIISAQQGLSSLSVAICLPANHYWRSPAQCVHASFRMHNNNKMKLQWQAPEPQIYQRALSANRRTGRVIAMHHLMKMRGSFVIFPPQDDMILANTRQRPEEIWEDSDTAMRWHWRTWKLIWNQTWVGQLNIRLC